MTDEKLLQQLLEENDVLVWRRVLRADTCRDLPVGEIVQSVFNTVIRLWVQTPPEQRVQRAGWPGWIITITDHEVLNARRRVQRDRIRLTAVDEENLPRQLRHDDHAEEMPDDLALRAMMAQLTGTEAAVLELVVWQHMTMGEAATALGINRNTAAMSVQRLREKILAFWSGGQLKGAKKQGIARFAEALRRRIDE